MMTWAYLSTFYLFYKDMAEMYCNPNIYFSLKASQNHNEVIMRKKELTPSKTFLTLMLYSLKYDDPLL
jgi:hypothetical protein